jgi:heme iron utilization protein
MTSEQSLRTLITTQPLAALGTVQSGEPFVSMVPFAVEPNDGKLIIHVSTLAAHTKHMLENARVSILVVAAPSPDVSAQATPRVTIQGMAVQLDKASSEYEKAKAVYVQRFPQSLDLFGFADFSLFAIAPTSARFVAGFAQAMTMSAEEFLAALVTLKNYRGKLDLEIDLDASRDRQNSL